MVDAIQSSKFITEKIECTDQEVGKAGQQVRCDEVAETGVCVWQDQDDE